MSFRPLIRGFFFYVLKCVQHYSEENKAFPSPYSGILFLSGCIPKKPKWAKYVSVPSFGDSFFIPRRRSSLQLSAVRVSVPSFGDSFFICSCITHWKKRISCFRPLIRGFFFYIINMTLKEFAKDLFPSPHSGILFLSDHNTKLNLEESAEGFPSPHSGILFLSRTDPTFPVFAVGVSVPSFGDSFFIGKEHDWQNDSLLFPSPHSGILFLYLSHFLLLLLI